MLIINNNNRYTVLNNNNYRVFEHSGEQKCHFWHLSRLVFFSHQHTTYNVIWEKDDDRLGEFRREEEFHFTSANNTAAKDNACHDTMLSI